MQGSPEILLETSMFNLESETFLLKIKAKNKIAHFKYLRNLVSIF